ncbi:PD40 domain-containing protein, partial [Candidatus Babeliales bacterium]|nr:PD40 domain-containing protein [Candidatus Babeliales bacterium]
MNLYNSYDPLHEKKYFSNFSDCLFSISRLQINITIKKICIFGITFLILGSSYSQENLTYQKPPKAILELVNAPLTPSVQMDSKGENIVLLFRDPFKSIAELSEKEMRLGGLRINPKTNIGSRTNYYNNIEVMKATTKEVRKVTGIPLNARIANLRWSPDQKMVAFTNTAINGVEVWVLNIKQASVKKLTEANVNANLRNSFVWFKDNSALLVKMLPADRKELINTHETIPDGPTITVSSGSKAQNWTYQDLLKNPNDEHNFEQLSRSAIIKVNLDGSKSKWVPAAMYSSISFSPDGKYIMISAIKRPFSYIVPYRRFPSVTTIFDPSGKVVKEILEVPLTEVLPKGFMAVREGKRNLRWRADHPATLVWVEALDGGNPANKV